MEKIRLPREIDRGNNQLKELKDALYEDRPARNLVPEGLPDEVVEGLPNLRRKPRNRDFPLRKYAAGAKTKASIEAEKMEEKEGREENEQD